MGLPNQHLVGIAQVKISDNPADIIVAPNLGSCLGMAIYDPVLKKGGLAHCLLPLSKSDPEKAANNPYMFVDTGFTKLLETLLASGCDIKRLVIVAVGGANINDQTNVFEIGKRNFTVLKKLLWKNNLLLKGEHVGDTVSRTLSLHIADGKSILKVRGETIEL